MTSVVAANPQERAWDEGEAATIAAVSAMNVACASLVDAIAMLIDTGGWAGWGITSIEHWVQWKAAVSMHRAENLVLIARRRDELPGCYEVFRQGRLTEDAMVRIAKRVPAERDAEVAGSATTLTISQLTRVLACLPILPPPEDPDRGPAPEPVRERYVRIHERPDGSMAGQFELPPDEAAVVRAGLDAARDREFRDRQGLDDTEDPGTGPQRVTLADAFVRLARSGTDALDGTLQRTGRPGDRHHLVIHRDLGADGTLGPARLHHGPHLPDALARYLTCDTSITVALRDGLRLIGYAPTERTPNRRIRRWIEHRDGGCIHPLCDAKRWLHIHHLQHWEDGGATVGSNLVCLCPTHHRALHHGAFTIDGNPDHGTVVVEDRWGRRIEPPDYGARRLPADRPAEPTYRPPYGERLTEWTWN